MLVLGFISIFNFWEREKNLKQAHYLQAWSILIAGKDYVVLSSSRRQKLFSVVS